MLALMAAALAVTAGASSSGGSLIVTNVTCTTAGYAFTATGTGLPGNATLLFWVFDNLNPGPPPSGQFEVVTTDAAGSFTINFDEAAPVLADIAVAIGSLANE